MDRNVMTQNCILQFDMIRVRGGIIEPLPALFYELRYSPDQPRDEHGRFTFGNGGGSSGKGVDKSEKSDIMISGAISGALDPDSEKAQKHAEQYYESVRHMTTDTKRIAANTGFSEEQISKVKDHVFIKKHDLGNDEPERFYPNYDMAESWQRLIDGSNIQSHDITLLNHELMEQELMSKGMNQLDAHRASEKKYNYAKECKEYHAKTDKHQSK